MGSSGDSSLAPRTTNFYTDQVFDDLDPDPVFVDFGDDVLADLPTVISTKDPGGLRASASLRRVGAEAI